MFHTVVFIVKKLLVRKLLRYLKFQIKDENDKWQSVWSDRTLPRNRPPFYTAGIYINAEGPTHIHNVTFRDFSEANANGEMQNCGIKFKDDFNMGMGASSSVKGMLSSLSTLLCSFTC